MLGDRNAINSRERLTGKSFGKVFGNASALVESELPADVRDMLSIALRRALVIGREIVLEQSDSCVVELIDLLEDPWPGAVPGFEYCGSDVVAVGRLCRQDFDAGELGQLAQHFFQIDRREKEPVDVNVL